jgi:ABC-type nitrate/sulfonate/bicarbonate transport system substrate-binding protein
MSLVRLEVMYGHIDGANGKFARDPTGYLALGAGIFRKHGLEVSWQHVQGTEERCRKLEDGSAQISFVVGRAALQHFLLAGSTRLLGSSMNTCPFYLVAEPSIRGLRELRGKTLACPQIVGRIAPLARFFREQGLAGDVALKFPAGDQNALDLLVQGQAQAALLPRPFGFLAEEKGYPRLSEWPQIVDDPLPVAIETTATLAREREKDFAAFLAAHSEGIRYLKSHREETIRMLGARFALTRGLAAKCFDDYLTCLDERLTIDFQHLEKLAAEVAPGLPGGATKLASEWLLPGALRV